MKSKRSILNLFAALPVLTMLGCSTNQLSFERMTEAQLLAYNESVGLFDQVICTRSKSTASYIYKRTCRTIRQIATEGIGRLNSSSYSYVVRRN